MLKDRPQRSKRRLLQRFLGNELIVVSVESHEAHCLSPVAARVWEACDGVRTVEEIRRSCEELETMDPRLVEQTLEELRVADLLDPFQASRREATRRLATAGVFGLVAPVLTSIALPSPLEAQSQPNGGPCDENSDCATNCCSTGGRCKPDVGACLPEPREPVKDHGGSCSSDSECASGCCSLAGVCKPDDGACSGF